MKTISDVVKNAKEAERIIQLILDVYLSLPDNKKVNNGCFVTFLHVPSREQYSLFVGEMGEAEKEIFGFQSVEKAMRLRKHPEHVSGWQSKDPSQNLYGGSVRTTEEYIISVAGLHQMGDESIALMIGIKFGFSDETWAADIAVISNNMLFESLLDTVNKKEKEAV